MIQEMTDKIKVKGESGFSLLEVMIALVILGFGLLGISMLQVTAIQGNSYGMKMSEANALISAKIEECRQLPYEQVTDKTETGIRIEGDSTLYSRTVKVVSSPANDRKTVTVTVSWEDKVPHSTSFETIIANRNIL